MLEVPIFLVSLDYNVNGGALVLSRVNIFSLPKDD